MIATRASLFWLGLALLGACARPDMPALADAERGAEGPSEAVAELLALAERSARGSARDERRLAATLTALDGYGARPAEGESDAVAGWQAMLSAKAVPPLRGRVLGPAYRRGMLAAGASVTLDQLFDGGRQARVAVATPGDGPLGIAVLDGKGRPICPPRLSRRGACNWVPPFSARHQIVLSNPGNAPSAYYLVID